MPLGLPCRHPAVVAGHAGTGRNAGMAVGCRRPACGAMATFARCSGGDMPLGFCGCAHAVAWHVTSGAVPRGSLENTLDMAGFAPCQQVCARQVKTGLNMIELYGAGTGRLRDVHAGQHHQRQYQDEAKPLGQTHGMKGKIDINFMPFQFAAP